MSSLVNCYNNVKDILGSPYQEPFEVVDLVSKLRNYWRPSQIKVVLLAESHVYTEQKDFSVTLDLSKIPLTGYPKNFVKFVYCLGYGEDGLLNGVVETNPGTWQYWQIFHSCVTNLEEKPEFNQRLLKKNTSLSERIKSKIYTLEKLKESGVWLLDASIAGLYNLPGGKPSRKLREKILTCCWDNHVGEEIEKAEPKHLIIVGKEIGQILEEKLPKALPRTILYQPQAQLKGRQKQLELYRSCSKICRDFIS